MTEQAHYPNGRDWCGYSKFIDAAKRNGRRYGFGRDAKTGAIGLFVESPVLLPSGRVSTRRRFASLMRGTGPMFSASTQIVWKQ